LFFSIEDIVVVCSFSALFTKFQALFFPEKRFSFLFYSSNILFSIRNAYFQLIYSRPTRAIQYVGTLLELK